MKINDMGLVQATMKELFDLRLEHFSQLWIQALKTYRLISVLAP